MLREYAFQHFDEIQFSEGGCYRCDSEVYFLLSDVAVSSHHSYIIPELCCQAMVRPAADILCTT